MKFYMYMQKWESSQVISEDDQTESGRLLDSETTTFSDDQSNLTHSRSTSCGSCELDPEEEQEQEHGKIGAFNRCVATLSGHEGWISCLALSGNDQEFLLSASQGRDIRVWQHPDLHHCTTFGVNGDEGSVKALLALGDKVVSGHQDQRIRVWQRSAASAKYKLLTTVPTAIDYLSNFMLQKNYVQTRRHHKRLWIQHADTISCLAAGNGFLYSGSWDTTLKVWRIGDFKCMQSIKAHDDAINAIAVDSDGFLYSASADCKIKVWANNYYESTPARSEHHHQLVATLEGHKSSVNALAVSVDGRLVYSGGSDRCIMAWEASKFSLACTLPGHRLAVLCLCAVGDLLCSGSADKTIRLWRREAPGSFLHYTVAVLRGHDGPVKCISASADVATGFLIYSGGLDRSIKVWWVSGHIKTRSLLMGIHGY